MAFDFFASNFFFIPAVFLVLLVFSFVSGAVRPSMAELAAAENVEREFLGRERWRAVHRRCYWQKFRLHSDCGMLLSGEHFFYGHANLAGKFALELLRAARAGDATFRFHRAIEAAVHFVEKRLTGP